jgi:hypothetical protein
MGLIINKKINFTGGLELDSFYARIETYNLHKGVGQLDLIMGHYVDKEGADKALPIYREDIVNNHAGATLPYEIQTEDKLVEIPRIISVVLSGSSPLQVEEWDYTNEWKVVEEEVIDYDDDGKELQSFTTKKVKVQVSSSRMVEKTKVYDKDFKKENFIEFAYSKVKDIYNKEFGSDNVKDLI